MFIQCYRTSVKLFFIIADVCYFLHQMMTGVDAVDWSYAQHELLEKQGVDLRKEMQAR